MQGIAEKTNDGYTLRFERHLTHPIESVWDAITKPEELTKWLAGDQAIVEMRVGGRVWMSGHGGIEATVLELDPPRRFSYAWKTAEWDGGPIVWELEEEGDGTKLTLTHLFPEPDMEEQERMMKKMGFGPDMYDPIPRTLAGWHSLIQELEWVLDGKQHATDTRSPVEAAGENRWKDLHAKYKQLYATTGS